MKKTVIIIITICMILSLAAFSGPTENGTLPSVGDVVEGFCVKEIRDIPSIGATAVLFEHEKTGAGLLYIANEDINRAFDLTFFTEAVDNTGLPHVFEHATLSGSRKYPSQNIFFNLMYQTYNTYLNAETGQLYTTYPMSSLSEAQLLKYADFYTDSCLYPRVLEDESIFREEAWRYRLDSPDDELGIEGTVYSEMLSSLDLNSMSHYNLMRAAFPGASVGNIAGGDPAEIPNMSWEDLKAFHGKYYHPSNCMAYLYGKFEDYTAFLKLLDGEFSAFDRRDISFDESVYEPSGAPLVLSVPFPAESSSDTENASVIYYAFICPGLKDDPDEEMAMNTLTDLLSADASCLMRTLKEEMPYGYFGSFIDLSGPEDMIVFCAMYVNADDAERFREIVDESLEKAAAEGFSDKLAGDLSASLALRDSLVCEDPNLGTALISGEFAPSLAETGDPFYYGEYIEAITRIPELNSKGVYKSAVKDNLLNNPNTVLVTTYPEPGLKEELDAEEELRLSGIKKSMSEEELLSLTEASSELKENEDSSEYVKQLQAVSIASLPEETRKYEISDTTGRYGIRHLSAETGTDALGEVILLLDASGIKQEDLQWYSLYLSLLGELDTSLHTKDELTELLSRYCFGWNVNYSLMTQFGTLDYDPYISAGWIARDGDLNEGYDLMYELMFETQFTDTGALAENISNRQSMMKNSLGYGAYSTMLYRELGACSPDYAYNSYLTGLDAIDFYDKAAQLMESSPETVISKLQYIQELLKNRSGAISVFAGDSDMFKENETLADAFFGKLEDHPVERQTYSFEAPAKSEALVIDSNVQYNGIVADTDTLGIDAYSADLDAVSALVLDEYLIPKLRDEYGVYTPMHSFSGDKGAYLITYSDPNIKETFEVYSKIPEFLSEYEADQETLNGYILSSYSSFAAPEGELSGAVSAVFSRLRNEPEDLRVRRMEELKSLDSEKLASYASLYAKMVENGRLFTVGGKEAINKEADLYDSVLDPLKLR